jgi:hypothetical protein
VLLAAAAVCAIGILSARRPELAVIAVGASILAALLLRDLSYGIAAGVLFGALGEPLGLSYKSLPLGVVNLFSWDLLLLALAGGTLLAFLRDGDRPALPKDAASIVLLLYLAYGLFSLARSVPLHGKAALLAFRYHFLYALFFFVCLRVLRRRAARRRVLIAVLASAAALALFGLHNAWRGTPVGTITSTFTYHYLSSLEAMSVFFGLVLLTGSLWPARRPTWSVAAALLLLAAILVSQARSVWLGAALGLLPLLLRGSVRAYAAARPVRTALALAAAGLLVVLFVAGLDVSGQIAVRAASLTHASADVTVLWRVFVWLRALGELAASPVLGLGLGKHFSYFDVVRASWQGGRQLHNSYLVLAYYTGAIGAGLLILFQALVLLRVLRSARRHAGTSREAVLLSLAACQICLAFVAFTNVVAESMVATTYTWILSAAAVLESREDPERPARERGASAPAGAE